MLIERFIQDNTYGDRGTFSTHKFLQDLLASFVAMGGIEGQEAAHRRQFFHRFQLISDTVYDLEKLAAAHNISATGNRQQKE